MEMQSFADTIHLISRAVRTAVGKAKRGSFKNTGPDNLLAPVLKHLVQTTPQIKPELYGDVVIGTVLPPGAQVSHHSSISLELWIAGQLILAMIHILLYSPSIRWLSH
jgi:acetyl-CoA acetyltransferase